MVRNPGAADEPVSPELVLVADPEEARLARERLADASSWEWEEFLANVRARTGVEQRAAAEDRPRPRKLRPLIVVVSALVVAAAVAIGVVRVRNGGSDATSTSSGSTQPAAAAPASTKPTENASGRVWSWSPFPGAKGYLVRLVRNGKTVLEVRTERSRLVVSKRFTFLPGRYRWTVAPLGVQRRRLLVNSSFVVPSGR
jgi:hypothetical protein